MTELLTRRHMLRGLFAMPAVILTPKLLMPIRAWIPGTVADLTFFEFALTDAEVANLAIKEALPIEVPPQFFKWVVVTMEENGERTFSLTESAEQLRTIAEAA